MPVPRTTLRPVLVVDDSIDDAFILSRLLQRSGVRSPIQIARNGEEAQRLLEKTKADPNFLPPAAIFIDMNMPGSNGLALLAWLRDAHWLAQALTIVVSTSDEPSTVRRAYEAGCHAYVPKYPTATDCEAFRAAMDALESGLPLPPLPGLDRNYDGFRWRAGRH